MTKIAIPHWQGRVSPVFDVAGRVAVAEFVSGGALRHGDVLLESEDPQARAAVLASAGVEVLICEAISCCYELALTAAGIEVISQICGETERVLHAYAEGRLSYYRMPRAAEAVMAGQGIAGAVNSGRDQKGKKHYENCHYNFGKRSPFSAGSTFWKSSVFSDL